MKAMTLVRKRVSVKKAEDPRVTAMRNKYEARRLARMGEGFDVDDFIIEHKKADKAGSGEIHKKYLDKAKQRLDAAKKAKKLARTKAHKDAADKEHTSAQTAVSNIESLANEDLSPKAMEKRIKTIHSLTKKDNDLALPEVVKVSTKMAGRSTAKKKEKESGRGKYERTAEIRKRIGRSVKKSWDEGKHKGNSK